MQAKVGDKVRYSTTWLRACHEYYGDIPHMVGKVVRVEHESPLVLLVKWDIGETSKVLARNLEVIG